MRIRLTVAAAVLLCAASLQAQVTQTIRNEQKFSLAPGGSFVLENGAGNVTIIGADVPQVEAKITAVINAQSPGALEEARRISGLLVGGTPQSRVVRTGFTGTKSQQWSAKIHWDVRVPKNSHVRVIATSGGQIKVANILGNALLKNFSGNIHVANVLGSTQVDTINGTIQYSTPRPRGNVTLRSVNGNVTASVAGDGDFRWNADTVRGDIKTNMAPRGAFFGTQFRGSINAPGGITITTASFAGTIHLFALGPLAGQTQSLRTMPATAIRSQPVVAGNGPEVMRRTLVKGLFSHRTTMGDVRVQEIQGDARIFTGAGEVQLGSVSGSCQVESHGGPMQLGEILGPLTASTRAGDILVDSARRGGSISTRGGTIRLLYTSGPTRLASGGGDIVVRQAAAPITAETASGDVSITVDAASSTETIDARTGKGNIILHVGKRFRGDIDATIVTNDPQSDQVTSEIPGLTIRREQVAGQTRVRATGKINGGGEKVVLHAVGGDIRITTGTVSPTVVAPR